MNTGSETVEDRKVRRREEKGKKNKETKRPNTTLRKVPVPR
jgi:hypothetical protein